MSAWVFVKGGSAGCEVEWLASCVTDSVAVCVVGAW